jgi:hypothetical protein
MLVEQLASGPPPLEFVERPWPILFQQTGKGARSASNQPLV